MNMRVQGSGLDTCCRNLSSRCECLVVLLQPHAVWKLRDTPSGRSTQRSKPGPLKAAGQRQKVNNRHRQLGHL